jgi:replicative DNA helicase
MITEALIKQIDLGRKGRNKGYSMGLPKLESVVDGVTSNTYTLIFSPSGVGKSSLALYSYIYRPAMEHLNDNNFKVFYASLEMSADLLFAKLLGMYIFENYGIELSPKELLSKKKDFILSDEHYQIIQECIPWLKRMEEIVTIYDKGMNAEVLYSLLMADLQDMGKFTETEHRKIYIPDNPDLVYLVVVDHASLLRPNKGRTLKEEIDLVSSYLVTLRNMCRISPLVIMQANRDSAGMERRKQGLNNMRLSDTKDSGGPVQDSEIVISIFSPHRERLTTYNKYNIGILTDRFRSITVLKNRYGESDVEVGTNFFGKCGIWNELPKPDDIYDYERYTNPNYLLENSEEIADKSNIEDDTKNDFNFIL